jgi:hypothetical protein
MKKNLLLTCLFTVSLLFCSLENKAVTLIHYWNFNNVSTTRFYVPSIPTTNASFSLIDTNKAVMTYTALYGSVSSITSTSLDATTGDILNARLGAPAGNCARVRNESDSMQLRFYIPSNGYKNLVINYECQRTTSGPRQQTYDYSLDSGATFIQTGLSATTAAIDTPWAIHTVSITNTLAENNPKLIFRIRFTDDSSKNISGNDRFDNLTVEGDAIPTSVTTTENNNNVSVYPNPVMNVLNIRMMGGEKNIAIYNVLGQKVMEATTMEELVSYNTAAIQAGVYYIYVSTATESVTTKFIKE